LSLISSFSPFLKIIFNFCLGEADKKVLAFSQCGDFNGSCLARIERDK